MKVVVVVQDTQSHNPLISNLYRLDSLKIVQRNQQETHLDMDVYHQYDHRHNGSVKD